MSVVFNTTAPESTLKKKSNAIAYHFVRESVAADICRIAYEPSQTNLADILTKVQTGPERKRLAQMILFKSFESTFPANTSWDSGTSCNACEASLSRLLGCLIDCSMSTIFQLCIG